MTQWAILLVYCVGIPAHRPMARRRKPEMANLFPHHVFKQVAKIGKVFLVGAGPGDPGLLTLRGAQTLREADIVLYDYLASPQLLAGTRDDAELICLGRHGRGRLWTQREINERMIHEARQGRTVVRLKGGDPAVFGRLAEELTALDGSGIAYEIVPGVTAAVAVASYAGISLTHRDAASCVALVTGQESPGKDSADGLDFAALARFPGTLVFYMGVTSAHVWSRALLDHGKAPDTPVAVVRRCSLPDQQTIIGTLKQLPALLSSGQVRPPAVVVVGQVAQQTHAPNWFQSRPLFGKTVLVTRPQHQAAATADMLAEHGAKVLCQPAIEIGPPQDEAGVDRSIADLASFDWVVFSSANGVRWFLLRLFEQGRDVRALGTVRIAAIGPATVDALAEFHLQADLCPDSYHAEALAEALKQAGDKQRFLLIRASRGREVLSETLMSAGADVAQVVAYTSRDVEAPDAEIAAEMAAGRIDWTTVTSSAIARSLVRLFGDDLRCTKLAAISPVTAETLRECGFEPAVVADVYTTEGLIRAILVHC